MYFFKILYKYRHVSELIKYNNENNRELAHRAAFENRKDFPHMKYRTRWVNSKK